MKKIFIGSSKESTRIAEELAEVLGKIDGVSVEIWDQSIGISHSTIDDLTKSSSHYSGAIFILADDDKLESRGEAFSVARDNVLFEYGMFIGALGKDRVSFVRVKNVKLMSDIVGITYIPYTNNSFSTSRSKIREWVSSLPSVLALDDYQYNHRMFIRKNEIMSFEYKSLNSAVFINSFDAIIKCDHLRCIDASFMWVYGGSAKISPFNPKDELIFQKKENRFTRYFLYLNNRFSHGDTHTTGFKFEYSKTEDLSTMHLNYDASYDCESPIILRVKIPDNMMFVSAKTSFRMNNGLVPPLVDTIDIDVDGKKELEFGNDIMLKAGQGISLDWTVKKISTRKPSSKQ